MAVLHAISVDVEDWFQSTVDPNSALSERFESSTQKILNAFAAAGIRGTFFVLGLAAKKAPHVIRAIAQSGHEIQSHGYGHRMNYDLTPEEFRQDLVQAKGIIEDISGSEVYAYRAPCFSIDERNLWALDVIAETGHRYDSSIFPVKMSRYGIDGYPPQPALITTPHGHRLVEAPVACIDWWGKRCPVGGGGYFRLWPYWIIRKAWKRLEEIGRPGIVYLHPYEYDPFEMSAYGVTTSFMRRLHQGLGRKGFPHKIDQLLCEFRFGPMCEVLQDLLGEMT